MKQLSPHEREVKLLVWREHEHIAAEAPSRRQETVRTIPVTMAPHVESGSTQLEIQFL